MERNLALYPVYQVFRNTLFWLPVFFLYFAAVLPVGEVLLLEAIYYLAVVFLEVPSGYFSDRVGRRITLVLASVALVSSAVLFAATSSFVAFAGGQVLLAIAISFNSGTDSALLYDSLAALDRAGEIGLREARAQSRSFFAIAASALIGGALAGFDLRWAYVLSALGGVGALVCAWRLTEPPRSDRRAMAPGQQIKHVLGQLRDRQLAWVFAFIVVLTVIEHVPYEFFQPYVGFLFGGTQGYTATPLVSGVLIGAAMAVAGVVSARAMAIEKKLGPVGALLGMLALEGAVIATMGLVLHPLVMVAIALRSVPQAVARPIVNAIIHPKLTSEVRATYLSVQSLAGRFAFSASLAAASAAVGARAMTPGIMSEILIWFAVAAAGLVVILAIASRSAMRGSG